MPYTIVYHPRVAKEDLPKIPQNIKRIIQRAVEERLFFNPVAYGQPLRKSLKGYRKLRVGDYRVIYEIQKNEVIIFKIGHRKEVYSQIFSRLK
jgi:mRNA interferase RelE/StbE